MMFEVEVRNVAGEPAAIGNAGPYTVVMDRPVDGGGRGVGFNGGQLLYLAIAGCISNDLFREASAAGIDLQRVRVLARGDFSGDPAVSAPIEYEVELSGDASAEALRELAARVDEIAEIPELAAPRHGRHTRCCPRRRHGIEPRNARPPVTGPLRETRQSRSYRCYGDPPPQRAHSDGALQSALHSQSGG
jgi:putative redox protein